MGDARLGTRLQVAGPRRVELVCAELGEPGPDEVLIHTEMSAVSSGTELLAYRGELPPGATATADGSPGLGYALVGRENDSGRRVFCLKPHQDRVIAKKSELVYLPDALPPERAVFLANMETAVNLVQDGHPRLGERVAVFGLGIVGLLTSELLKQFPIELHVKDLRREKDEIQENYYELCYELSGQPQTLNEAIEAAAFCGRIVVGSWYGQKTAPIELGGAFHRRRLKLISSQVSTIEPCLSGTWSKERRLQLALRMLDQVRPERFISHRRRLDEAGDAYRLLDCGQALQVVFCYA